MITQTIRLLKPGEIECRVATINEKGISLLLYKDARVDQKILDETFGIFGWKRFHQSIDGNLYCTVEIYSEDLGQWVGKQDVGTESFTEKEKSQCSDSFKRACFNIGIGRELYTAPFIWIPSTKANIQNRNGKYYCTDGFLVKDISYNDDREIEGLSICNNKGQIVFEQKAPIQNTLTKKQLTDFKKELLRTGVTEQEALSRYNLNNISEMSEEIYNRIMIALSKTRAA